MSLLLASPPKTVPTWTGNVYENTIASPVLPPMAVLLAQYLLIDTDIVRYRHKYRYRYISVCIYRRENDTYGIYIVVYIHI